MDALSVVAATAVVLAVYLTGYQHGRRVAKDIALRAGAAAALHSVRAAVPRDTLIDGCDLHKILERFETTLVQ